jgi:hypothetical protein
MRAGEEFGGTPNRFTGLRRLCLIRDHHRCVISREYEMAEAIRRTTSYGDDAEDDDGHPISDKANSFNILKLAHIIPHSLTRIESGSSQLVDIIPHFEDSCRLLELVHRVRNRLS